MALRAALVGLILTVLAVTGAQAAKRALVIGNNAYEGGAIDVLERAVADAEAYAQTLREERGFEVTLVTDAGRAKMLSALATFVSSIQPGDVAMFVFSGHAMQLDPNRRDQLYLFPTDVSVDNWEGNMRADLFLESYTISFATIADQMTRSGARLRVFVLDACRNPPRVGDAATRNGGLSVGIGRVASGEGEFIFYSAGPGEEALDRLNSEAPGSEGTSVFTRIFLDKFKSGVYLEDIANEVQAEVKALAAKSNHTQRPYYSDGVTGWTCLDERCGRDAMTPNALEIEESFWQLCRDSGNPRYCRAYLERFPKGPRAMLAALRVEELEAERERARQAAQRAREAAERERAARERAARETARREEAARKAAERVAAERARAAAEQAARERAAAEEAARKRAAREAAARDDAERERAARAAADAEKAAREAAKLIEAERERAARAAAERAAAERKAAREKAAREKAARERAETERKAREAARQKEAERARAAEEARQARERAEREARERKAARRATPPPLAERPPPLKTSRKPPPLKTTPPPVKTSRTPPPLTAERLAAVDPERDRKTTRSSKKPPDGTYRRSLGLLLTEQTRLRDKEANTNVKIAALKRKIDRSDNEAERDRLRTDRAQLYKQLQETRAQLARVERDIAALKARNDDTAAPPDRTKTTRRASRATPPDDGPDPIVLYHTGPDGPETIVLGVAYDDTSRYIDELVSERRHAISAVDVYTDASGRALFNFVLLPDNQVAGWWIALDLELDEVDDFVTERIEKGLCLVSLEPFQSRNGPRVSALFRRTGEDCGDQKFYAAVSESEHWQRNTELAKDGYHPIAIHPGAHDGRDVIGAVYIRTAGETLLGVNFTLERIAEQLEGSIGWDSLISGRWERLASLSEVDFAVIHDGLPGSDLDRRQAITFIIRKRSYVDGTPRWRIGSPDQIRDFLARNRGARIRSVSTRAAGTDGAVEIGVLLQDPRR